MESNAVGNKKWHSNERQLWKILSTGGGLCLAFSYKLSVSFSDEGPKLKTSALSVIQFQ